MANTKQRVFRAGDYDWNRAMSRAVAEGGSLSGVLRDALRAYAEAMTDGTQFFTSSSNNALLRRVVANKGTTDEVYRSGSWHDTDQIAQYMIGDDTNVEPISEAQARKIVPDAF